MTVLADYILTAPCAKKRWSRPRGREAVLRMSKPTIFTISARWNDEASVWSGHSDDIPAAADAPTLDELLAELSAMTLDLLPDNHPEIDPASVYLQITTLREADPVGILSRHTAKRNPAAGGIAKGALARTANYTSPTRSMKPTGSIRMTHTTHRQ